MRFVILDGKKLGVIIIVLGLMVVVFGLGINLNTNIRATAFIESNMGTLKKFSVNAYNISYKLPSKWKTNLELSHKSEVIYHNNFSSQHELIYGFVEMCRLEGDLKLFLNKSEILINDARKVESYNLAPVKINNFEGYEITYKFKSNNQTYSAYEYFVKTNTLFVRFSFFINTRNSDESIPSVFKAIVDTIRN